MMARTLLLLSILLLGARARADDTARAKAHFVKGEAHFSLGEFRAALEEYRRAYLLRPLPPLLFNMAQCHRHLGELERAAFLLRRFLEARPAERQRQQAEAVLALVERARAQRPASAPASAPAAPASRRAPTIPPAASGSTPAAAAPAPVTPRVAVRDGRPIYRRWWFWTALGGVATGIAVAASVAATRGREHPSGTLAPVDWR